MRLPSTIGPTVVAVLAAVPIFGVSLSHAAEPRTGVELYLLEDAKMDFETARTKPLVELVLRAKPWIAAEDIERYDWSTHYVYLKKPVAVPVPAGHKFVLLRGTPFVVVADGQRCYLGALWTLLSSFSPLGSVPIVDTVGNQFDRFAISLHTALRRGESPTDVRRDPRVMKALRSRGQYHAGLQVSLDKVRVEQKGETSVLTYSYTLRNADEDALYVMDPERIHPAFFHDFQNGVSGQDVDDGVIFRWPNPRHGDPQPTPWGKLDVAWLSRVNKGEQMTRTVSMDAMPRILPGKYECCFSLGSGGYSNVKKEQLQLPDGRLWLGRITATLTVEVPGKQSSP
jgi:hypothetical protein